MSVLVPEGGCGGGREEGLGGGGGVIPLIARGMVSGPCRGPRGLVWTRREVVM